MSIRLSLENNELLSHDNKLLKCTVLCKQNPKHWCMQIVWNIQCKWWTHPDNYEAFKKKDLSKKGDN